MAKDQIKNFLVKPGSKVNLKDYDPEWFSDKNLSKKEAKKRAKQVLAEDVGELEKAQDVLYASDTWSVLIIFQAIDAAGKDGTIKHVMSGVNPQGCQVYSFKKPTSEELDHNFLWRCMKALPERGRIGIFNRSYYEEVLVVKVHQELLKFQRLPETSTKEIWAHRYEDINNFEQHISRNGTLVLKFFLHVSKEEQKRRFLERLEHKEKNWKFSLADLQERAHWDTYMKAYEEAISATSTKWAPWYIVPADHKWATRSLVANIITSRISDLNLSYPKISPETLKALKRAKNLLISGKI